MAKCCTSKNLTCRPALNKVFRFMFERFDRGRNVCCLSCNKVMEANGDETAFESHLNTCVRTYCVPAEETAFNCGPCDAKIPSFNQWQHHHVTTEDHRHRCSAAARLYSETCDFCHVILYGAKEFLERHNGAHVRDRLQNISKRILPLMMTKCMAYVYAVHSAHLPEVYAGTVYYCSGCAKWTEGRSIHWPLFDPDRVDECHRGKSKFRCAPCRASFVCNESEYTRHLESVEHCVLSEKVAQRQHNDAYEGWTVPRIMRRHFNGLLVAKNKAPSITDCKLCGCIVLTRFVLDHMFTCTRLSRVEPRSCSDKKATNYYNGFRCSVCSLWLAAVKEWTLHVISESHLTKCTKMFKYIYYECTMCFHLYYGTGSSEEKSFCKHALSPLQDLTYLMRYVFGEMSRIDSTDVPKDLTYYYWQKTGNFGQCDPSGNSTVPHYCQTCRLEFYSDSIAFRKHTVTAEHLLLQHFVPIKSSLHGQKDDAVNLDEDKNKNVHGNVDKNADDNVFKNAKRVQDDANKKPTGNIAIKKQNAHTQKRDVCLKIVQDPSLKFRNIPIPNIPNLNRPKTQRSRRNPPSPPSPITPPSPPSPITPPSPPSLPSPVTPPSPPSPITPPSPPSLPSPVTPPNPPSPITPPSPPSLPSPITPPSPPSPY